MSHNANDPRHLWTRLTSAARTVRDLRDTAAPYGFATRLVALAFAQERKVASLLDRFALRALGVACLLAIVSVALNYQSLPSRGGALTAGIVYEFDTPLAGDAVALVLDLAD